MGTANGEDVQLMILEQEGLNGGIFYRLQLGGDGHQADIEVRGDRAWIDVFGGKIALSALVGFIMSNHPETVAITYDEV